MRKRPVVWLAMLGAFVAASRAGAHPEFQKYLAEHAPRHTDCAMCHRHPDGPEGPKPGQIGSLDPEEIERLQRARAAFEPGPHPENLLLNDFGNAIVTQLGKREVLKLRQDPGRLAEVLDPQSDLDADGVSDAKEYLAGTLPTDPQSGPPLGLFVNNLKRYRLDIALIVLATIAGIYGLSHLLRWFELAWPEEGEDESPSTPAQPATPVDAGDPGTPSIFGGRLSNLVRRVSHIEGLPRR